MGLQATPPDYSVATDPQTLLWNIFNGLGIMAFAYGNTVLPGGALPPVVTLGRAPRSICSCMQMSMAWSHRPWAEAIKLIMHAGCAEIGACAKAPADQTMRKGIVMGYIIIIIAYLTVSITGAEGSHACCNLCLPFFGCLARMSSSVALRLRAA